MGCRRTDDQGAMVRIVRGPDGLVVSRTGAGRGVWLHPGCGALALKRKALGRALRGDPGPPDAVAALLAGVDARADLGKATSL
ncbi:YlxR family protein [Propioniciclava sp.]|uniref:YlxR family protein n=1 Tax=Propioniciclava sp. TaxID=2038686 RepID=UPI00261E0772|nr:YlxR family protein [Propioniciclava sp.]